MFKYGRITLLITLLALNSSCGKSSDSSAPVDESLPTEVIDEQDHSSEIPNDPHFESAN